MSTKQSVYKNMYSAQEDSEKALQWARRELCEKGYSYPSATQHHSITEFYDAMREYGEREAALVRQYFKDRAPIAEPKVKERKLVPAKPIAMPYYDD